MNPMTEDEFVILVLHPFPKLGDQPENNFSSNAGFSSRDAGSC
jgi:hypothetical protein